MLPGITRMRALFPTPKALNSRKLGERAAQPGAPWLCWDQPAATGLRAPTPSPWTPTPTTTTTGCQAGRPHPSLPSPAGSFSYRPAGNRLQKRGIVPRMGHPTFPGVELWITATGARNHASHYASASVPMRAPQHMLDPVLASLARMVEALWQEPSSSPTDGTECGD